MSSQSEINEARDLLKTVRGFERRNPPGVVQKNRSWLEPMVTDAQQILQKHGATGTLNSAAAGSDFIHELLHDGDGSGTARHSRGAGSRKRLTATERRICELMGIDEDTFLAGEEPEGL